MSYETKTEAQEAGKALLARMKGTGWKLDVWENLGWQCSVRNGPVQIHDHRGEYSCLVSDDLKDPAGGNGEWTTNFSSKDPNKAAAHEIRSARRHLNRYTKAVEFAENIAPKKVTEKL